MGSGRGKVRRVSGTDQTPRQDRRLTSLSVERTTFPSKLLAQLMAEEQEERPLFNFSEEQWTNINDKDSLFLTP